MSANTRSGVTNSTGVPDSSGASADAYKLHAIGLSALFILTLPTIILLMVLMEPLPPKSQWADLASQFGVEPIHLAVGESFYIRTCAVCHGQNGDGVPRLGKPLRNSEYVQSLSDDELFEVIAQGRTLSDPENTTGAIMPPRANSPLLDDERLRFVVSYLRTMQDPDAPTASLDDWIVATASESGEASAGLVGASQGVGHDTFVASCSACHGTSGQGMDGLGKPLLDSPFITDQSDEELMQFIKLGRPIWDDENTTGVDMPPKGGNPALSDEEIMTIIKYLRAMHDSPNGG